MIRRERLEVHFFRELFQLAKREQEIVASLKGISWGTLFFDLPSLFFNPAPSFLNPPPTCNLFF